MMARLPMKCMHQIPTRPMDVAQASVSSQLLQLPSAVPRRCSISIVSRHPVRLAKYEAATMPGLKWLLTDEPTVREPLLDILKSFQVSEVNRPGFLVKGRRFLVRFEQPWRLWRLWWIGVNVGVIRVQIRSKWHVIQSSATLSQRTSSTGFADVNSWPPAEFAAP